MKNYFLKLLIVLMVLTESVRLSAQRYQPRYKTIAHKVLALENRTKKIMHPQQSQLLDDSLAMHYKLLDHFISTCLKVCPDFRPGMIKKDVLQIMHDIDSTLYALGGYICVKVEDLSEVFVPIPKNLRACQGCLELWTEHNYRERYKDSLDTFYKMDCDLSSIIYLSIAELKHYPMYYIEVPKHNFVRWRFSAVSSLNWDTNLGKEVLDESYRLGESGATSTGFNVTTEANMPYLKDLDSNYILAEWYAIEGLALKRLKMYPAAIAMYQTALDYDPLNYRALHFLSWLYLYYPQYDNRRNTALAYKYETLVYNMKKEDYDKTEYTVTYGCACAAVGDFKKAYAIVASVSKDLYLLESLKAKKKCNRIYPQLEGNEKQVSLGR